jgi:hypothetical protein
MVMNYETKKDNMRNKSNFISVVILLFFSFSCKEAPPEPSNGSKGNGMLIVEDVGVTDAVLRLRVPGGFKSRSITLRRDTTTILTKQITSLDTTIIDEELLPKHSYKYTLTVNNFLNTQEHSYANITTMDTTSHKFTWQIDTLGDGSSHGFSDVAIINDTCVIAVGEIYKKDSLGNWINPPYNLARWNGKEWSLKRVMYNYQGIDYYSQLYSIFAFDENDYWVGSNQPMHWAGNMWETFDLVGETWNGWINKIWGTSSDNLYFVGSVGRIVKYDGNIWQKIDSGTDLDIEDIYGSRNLKTGEEEVLAVASKSYDNRDGKILKIDGLNVTILPDSGIDDALTGVWFMSGKKYYVTGGSIYKKRNSLMNPRWSRDVGSMYPDFKTSIRGNDINDILIACDRGNLLHFDGYSWDYYYRWTRLDYGNYYSVAIKNNLVVAVGDNYGRGVIAMGRR